MTNVETVMIEQPRIARFQTVSPGCADRPCTPGSASRPWAIVAACESPTTSTFTGLGGATGEAAEPVAVPAPLESAAGVAFGTTGGPPDCATSPTAPLSTGRELRVAANTPTPTATTSPAVAT